mgnify:CR=1 FL=1
MLLLLLLAYPVEGILILVILILTTFVLDLKLRKRSTKSLIMLFFELRSLIIGLIFLARQTGFLKTLIFNLLFLDLFSS